MFYSKFQNRKCFEAVFADDETFYRVTIFTTGFSIIFVTLPLIVASVFAFIYINLWYQVKMFCVECIVIEVFMIIYMSFDLYRIIKQRKGAKNLSSMPFPASKPNYMVKSAPTDEDAIPLINLKEKVHDIKGLKNQAKEKGG